MRIPIKERGFIYQGSRLGVFTGGVGLSPEPLRGFWFR